MLYFFALLVLSSCGYDSNSALQSEQPDKIQKYYENIDFSEHSSALKYDLQNLINETYDPIPNSYSRNWGNISFIYANPEDEQTVVLVYGSKNDNNFTTDLTRPVSNRGGHTGNWNREHIIPKSKSGSSKDLFNLHPSDLKQNSNRGNLRFEDDEGLAHKTTNGWYPGDRWKGDVARTLLYFYLKNDYRLEEVFIGDFSDAGVPAQLIEWHNDDPVDEYEMAINDRMQTLRLGQGNRNPFVDHPNLVKKLQLGEADASDKVN